MKSSSVISHWTKKSALFCHGSIYQKGTTLITNMILFFELEVCPCGITLAHAGEYAVFPGEKTMYHWDFISKQKKKG